MAQELMVAGQHRVGHGTFTLDEETDLLWFLPATSKNRRVVDYKVVHNSSTLRVLQVMEGGHYHGPLG